MAQVQLLRSKLLEAHRQLVDRARTRVPPQGTEMGMDPRGDAADQAELSFEQAVSAERSESDRRRLRDTEDALTRMDEGRYGICEGTGEPIGFERLVAEPWTRYSRDYEERLERAAGPRTPPTF